MTSWYQSPAIRSFDTETTGVDTDTARILQAAIVDIAPGQRPVTIQWLLDPGVDVPDEAAAVHGYTHDQILDEVGGPGNAVRRTSAGAEQIPAEIALFEIAMHLSQAMGREIPLVVANAPFDLTLLEVELGRNGIDTLASRPSGIRGVVDPMVIEKQYDTFRKVCYKAAGCDPETKHHECGGCRGSSRGFDCSSGTGRRGCGATDKTLESLCLHYGVPLVGAHDASADALAAARLSVRLGGLWGQVQRWKLETLHRNQIGWRKTQSDSLRDFWKKKGDERWREVDSAWPVRPLPAAVGVAS